MSSSYADPLALNVAAAIQRQLPHATVILYGSRARGDHRPDSDVDLLIVAHGGPQASQHAGDAASNYMKENPPWLEVNIVTMTLAEFQRNRLAKQHLAGQADHYGVVMSSEKLNYGADYDDDFPEHWPATRQRLENTAEWGKEFNDMVDQDHWNQKLMGFSAQQSVENALRGLLSAHNDPTTFRHGLQGIWDHYVENYHDPNDPGTEPLSRAVADLLGHTTYEDPESATGYSNWLTRYASEYRYNIAPRPMDRSEKVALQELVNNATAHLVGRVHELSGTSEDDIFPDGVPWQ